MYKKQVDYLLTMTMVIDSAILVFAGHTAAFVSLSRASYHLYSNSYLFVGILLLLIFGNNFIMTALGLYSDIRPESLRQMLSRLFLSVVILFMGLMASLYVFRIDFVPRGFIAAYVLLTAALFTLERMILDFYVENRKRTSFNARQILLVGDDERAYRAYEGLNKQRSWGHQFIGYLQVSPRPVFDFGPELPLLGAIANLKDILCERNVDEIIFALPVESSSLNLQEYINICEQTGVSYRIVPSMYNPASTKDIRVETIQGVPTITRNTIQISPTGLLWKRALDLAVGAAGMAVLAVMYPFVALAIRLDSPGPIVFRQPRVGQNGRIFHIYKFRTMVRDAEKLKAELMKKNLMQGHMFKMEDDPRITKVGRFLRKVSLDEFPQFINVIKGEMSIVGTRPPTVDEVKRYQIQHRRRISIKPGITGMWQVSGRNKITDFEEVVRLDLEYIDNWSFWRDLRIIWLTLWVVVARKGAL